MDREGLSAEELGRRFIDAFNRRDADAVVALCHPEVEFLPTGLVGVRAVYRGHDGMRRWMAMLADAGAAHQVRVLKARMLGPERFALLTETCIDDDVLSPSAMVGDLRDGLIVRAKGYLSDEPTLINVGVLPPADPVDAA